MPKPPTILVVDDEPEVRRVLRVGLEAEGYRILEAGSQDSLMRCLSEEPVDLITLDLGLGELDGLNLAREIRAVRNVPIIMITGRGTPVDRLVGLEHGADDYIVKPFQIGEVAIRVRNVLARYAPRVEIQFPAIAHPRRYGFDGCILDTVSREVRAADGQVVDLTETEFRMLELFVRNPERVLSRDEIWQALRGHDWSPLDRTLDGHVARLRRKIEAVEEDEPRLIKSVRGVGYVLASRVREI